jgi:hypothetical protein
MEMIRCPRCAREIPDSSRFCRRCGCAIVWRTQRVPAAAVAFPPAVQPSRPATLNTPRQATPASNPKPTVRSSGSGGAGVFAIFAAAGLVCFVNYHAVMRPMRPPTRTGTVRYESSPATPVFPPDVSPPYMAPPPPPAYPIPARTNAPSGTSRSRRMPQTPAFQIPTTPGAPLPPWDARYRYGSPRGAADTDSGSERSERR